VLGMKHEAKEEEDDKKSFKHEIFSPFTLKNA
jgi:hypothetical protein